MAITARKPLDPTPEALAAADAWYWTFINKIKLQLSPYELAGHEYQVAPLQSTRRVRVYKKGARMGFTEVEVLRSLHGMRYRILPAGVLYLFPTGDDVSDFSKGRFGPLLADNYEAIGKYVKDTDSTSIKKIGRALLYLRGARATQKVDGVKSDSSKLRSIGVDKVVFDEYDLMDPKMVDMALVRFDYSNVKEEVYLSTPTIPDWGIDKKFQESDQQHWMIKCSACNEWTCLELEFPECIKDRGDGTGGRVCRRCGREIHPRNGQWVAQHPGKEIEGQYISQLNLLTVDPLSILNLYLNPPNGNLQEVMNSKLGMAYIPTENRLQPHDLWPLMGNDMVPLSHEGPTAMGVDVGNNFHFWIVDRPNENQTRIVKVGEITSSKMTDFTPLHDLIKQYNVRSCVIDFAPVQKAVRAFRGSEDKCEVFGCIYQEQQRGPATWDVVNGIVRINRTEICDATHDLCTTPGKLLAPRRSPVMEDWVNQMCNLAKVVEEDKETGAKEFKYRKLGADHYRHAGNYAVLAAQRIGIYTPPEKKKKAGWRGEDKTTWKSV